MGGKRSAKKAPVKKVAPKLDKVFTCPFCNHEKTVQAKLNYQQGVGTVECSMCKAKYEMRISKLSDAIDVYSEWIDACEEANRPEKRARAAA